MNTVVVDPSAIFTKRLRAAKASFLLGLALFGAVYFWFISVSLPRLHLGTAGIALSGFGAGIWYTALGLIWSGVWALVLQLNLLLLDLAALVESLLKQAILALRAQFSSGAIVDLEIVQTQLGALVEQQTARWDAQSTWVPLVNQYAPVVAREGLRWAVVRTAGQVFEGDKLTVSAIEGRLTHLSAQALANMIRPYVRILLAVLLVLAALLLLLPIGLTGLLAYVL